MHKREIIEKDRITVRAAQRTDAAEIAALARALAEQEGEHPATTSETLLRDAFGEVPKCLFWVAEYENSLVAFLMAYEGYDLSSATSGMHLGDVMVEQAYRRLGIGERLLQILASYTLKNGGEWVSWTVGQENEAAQIFYRDCVKAAQVDVDFMAMGKTTLQRLTDKGASRHTGK